MSEATIQVEPPKFGGTPGNPVIKFNSMSDMLTKKGSAALAPSEPVEKVESTPETPVETPETKTEVPITPEAKKTPEAPAKGSKEDSLAALRKKAEQAEKDAADFRTKYEAIEKEHSELKQKPFELPEDVKTRLEKAEQERETYSKELAAAKLERHPEFIARYQNKIQNSVNLMAKIAVESGIDPDVVKTGMGAWNEGIFSEWIDGMNSLQRTKFGAALVEADNLFSERNQELADANKRYEEMSKAQQDHQKTQYEESLKGNERIAKGLLKKLIDDNEGTKDFEGLREAAEAVAMKAARYEMSPEEVFEAAISNQVLARSVVKQKATMDELNAKLAERDEKIKELEAFVANHAGSTPRPDAVGSAAGSEKYVPTFQRIQIKTS